MKVIIAFLLIIVPVMASAQNENMTDADMQKMGQAMQEMMQCMANIDQSELTAMEAELDKVSQELDELCKKGERKEAQRIAIAQSKEMTEFSAFVQMKKCGEIYKKYGLSISEGEGSPQTFAELFDFSNRHVCDDVEE